jgi:hypothetical protein
MYIMARMPPVPITIWTDGPRAAIVREALAAAGMDLAPCGVGGARRSEVDDLARELHCPFSDDLRKLLIEQPAAVVLLATMAGVGTGDLALALASGALILTLEPVASDFDRHTAWQVAVRDRPAKDQQSGRVLLTPAFTRAAGWTHAAEPQQVLGPPRLLSFTSFGRAESMSLFARTFDAWSTVLQLMGMPESVAAALGGVLGDAPDDPRGLTGHLTAHARWANGSAAVIQLSDRAGFSQRILEVVGDEAHLRVTDGAYELRNMAGELLDSHALATAAPGYPQLLADDWRCLLNRDPAATSAAASAGDDAAVLAACLACLLSTRTAQAESPATLLRLHGLA